MIDVLQHQIMRLPEQLRQTLARDQGQEMSRHKDFTIATGCPVFFCDPHSPWQRGSNENLNGLVRDHYPKGADFNNVSDAAIEAMAAQLTTIRGKPSASTPLVRNSTNSSAVLRWLLETAPFGWRNSAGIAQAKAPGRRIHWKNQQMLAASHDAHPQRSRFYMVMTLA
ncbi:hypothetical protein IWX65_003368 [Arthrobacter sp. CAN_A214]